MPSELGALISIKKLHVGNNQLSGQIPTEVGSLMRLGKLWLNELPLLSGLIPTEISLLPNLSSLNLSCSAGLSGVIPEQFCWLRHSGSCTFGRDSDECMLDFDCTDRLCGCDCMCVNVTL